MTEHEHAETHIWMPQSLTREMVQAVKNHQTTSCATEAEFHAKLGWLICAWDVLVELQQNRAVIASQEAK